MKFTEEEKVLMQTFYDATELATELQYFTEIMDGFCKYYCDTYHDLNRVSLLLELIVEKHKKLKLKLDETEELLCRG